MVNDDHDRRRPRPGRGTPSAPEAGSGPPWRHARGSDAELAARLRLAILRLSRRLRQQVAGGVTSSQVSALATVERLGTPTLGELAASEQVQPPSMTKIVVGLERPGWWRARRTTRPARGAGELTAEGRRTLARSRSLRNAYLVRRLRGCRPTSAPPSKTPCACSSVWWTSHDPAAPRRGDHVPVAARPQLPAVLHRARSSR